MTVLANKDTTVEFCLDLVPRAGIAFCAYAKLFFAVMMEREGFETPIVSTHYASVAFVFYSLFL